MSLKHTTCAAAILSLCVAIAPAPAAAQLMNCAELYTNLMAVYQAAPLSPQYNQLIAAYSTNCLAAAPAYAPFDAQDSGAYDQPPAAYAEPAYPYYGGYRYAVPVGVGIGLGFDRGFHHRGDFHDRGGSHAAAARNGGDPHRGGRNDGGRTGDHHEHH
jgi:hypothetical protein